MHKTLIFAVFASLLGCNPPGPLEPLFSGNRIYVGMFSFTYNVGMTSEFVEDGSITLRFHSSFYRYRASFRDTTLGRGRFYPRVADEGNYKLNGSSINFNDRAVTYGSGTILGSPSLYLFGDYDVLNDGNTVVLSKSSGGNEFKLTLHAQSSLSSG